jgi:uncharacterized Tic20 family protein
MSDSDSQTPSPSFGQNQPAQFGEVAAGPDYVPSQDERTLAMLAELLQLFTWIIGPLVIYLVKRDSRFVRFHAMQAILWQLLVMFGYIVFFVVLVIGVFATGPKGGGATAAPAPFTLVVLFCVYGLMGLLWLATMIVSIYFAVKAQGGNWSSYPLIGRAAKSMTA